MKFSYLNKEQIGRLDICLEIPPEPRLLAMFEPNVDNALNLVIGDECSDAELELSYETYAKLSSSGKVSFITRFTNLAKDTVWFSERFKRINPKFMPKIVDLFNLNGLYNGGSRSRRNPYTGEFAKTEREYFAKFNMPASDGKIIKKGSSFFLDHYYILEHGAIDANVQTAVNGPMNVILFPDEIKEIKR